MGPLIKINDFIGKGLRKRVERYRVDAEYRARCDALVELDDSARRAEDRCRISTSALKMAGVPKIHAELVMSPRWYPGRDQRAFGQAWKAGATIMVAEGRTDSGKSAVATRAIYRAHCEGKRILWVHAIGLARKAPWDELEAERAADVLVIDDVGQEDARKDMRLTHVETLICAFYDGQGEQRLLLTTNLPADVFSERYGGRRTIRRIRERGGPAQGWVTLSEDVTPLREQYQRGEIE